MQGDLEVIEFLNEALTSELTAINQYFAHYKICENWGFVRLAEKYKAESIEEMQDAEKLIDRIIFLEGMPNLQRLGSVNIGETVPEQFEVDYQLEVDAVARYKRGVKLCMDKGDYGTRELLERILVAEEEHADWIETQMHVLESVGLERYLQSQAESA